jgi:hypothetical protein
MALIQECGNCLPEGAIATEGTWNQSQGIVYSDYKPRMLAAVGAVVGRTILQQEPSFIRLLTAEPVLCCLLYE